MTPNFELLNPVLPCFPKSILMQKVLAVSFFVVAFAFGNPCTAQTMCGWNPDSNGDYVVTITDLLALLSVFEEVDADMDGIFDSQDSCIGIMDACGVCNGPGPTVPVIDEIVYVTDSLFVPPLGSWYVFSYAVDTLYTYVCPPQGCTDATAGNFDPEAIIDDGSCSYGPAQCGGQSTVTFDGHTYNLVGIGTQCWFKENLRSDNYRNGDPIPGDVSWTGTNVGALAIYGMGNSSCEGNCNETETYEVYGYLYNWYVVQDSRGVCPNDWHVSNESDWSNLISALGGANIAGFSIKSSSQDSIPWDGDNLSSFTALPAGFRNAFDGSFQGEGLFAYWWSDGSYPRAYSVYGGETWISSDYHPQRQGWGIRCVKDEQP
jgi:uncharacterized protein (TIGR02145 family)